MGETEWCKAKEQDPVEKERGGYAVGKTVQTAKSLARGGKQRPVSPRLHGQGRERLEMTLEK